MCLPAFPDEQMREMLPCAGRAWLEMTVGHFESLVKDWMLSL